MSRFRWWRLVGPALLFIGNITNLLLLRRLNRGLGKRVLAQHRTEISGRAQQVGLCLVQGTRLLIKNILAAFRSSFPVGMTTGNTPGIKAQMRTLGGSYQWVHLRMALGSWLLGGLGGLGGHLQLLSIGLPYRAIGPRRLPPMRPL